MSDKKYKYWKWVKNSSENKKTPVKKYQYNNKKIKDEIEKEIINMETSKKEICNERILNRDLIIQRNINPFLMKNDYLDDLEQQDKYLRPKDSNIDDKKK
tara:strand:+ start:83 stop:382 length:300 start_codon:yes stop_codon:yes gene_type:complete